MSEVWNIRSNGRLQPRRQRLGISLLLPLTEDLHVDVRAAACHALGALVVFPSLREVIYIY